MIDIYISGHDQIAASVDILDFRLHTLSCTVICALFVTLGCTGGTRGILKVMKKNAPLQKNLDLIKSKHARRTLPSLKIIPKKIAQKIHENSFCKWSTNNCVRHFYRLNKYK